MIPSILGDHLWQTTVAVLIAAVLARVVGARQPRIRHGIWLAASLKFLVPFSVLVAAGRAIAEWTHAALPMPDVPASVQALGQPFSVLTVATAGSTAANSGQVLWGCLLGVWALGCAARLGAIWLEWRRCAAMAARARTLTDGREVEALDRILARSAFGHAVTIRESASVCEPGLVGVFAPIILWPARLSSRLNDAAIEAVIAHEICHVRRADNLVSRVHVVVESLFWFHPMVWWLGARLVDERERACDEAVLGLGTPPEMYAESLLRVCRFRLSDRLSLIAGVAGANLNQRVEAIMTYHTRPSLGRGRRMLVALAALVVAIGPAASGALTARSREAVAVLSTVVSPAPIGVPHGIADPSDESSTTLTTRRATDMPRRTSSPPTASPLASMDAVASDLPAQNDAAASSGQVMRAGEPGLTNPVVLKEVKPRYPEDAMRAKIEGTVLLDVVVRKDGTVGDVTVKKSLDTQHGLDNQAIMAARGWRFQPATKDGVPVDMLVTLELAFRLGDDFSQGAYWADTRGLISPRAVQSVAPNYTPEAMRNRIQGQVIVEAVVLADGTVARTRVAKSLDALYGLDEEAVKAMTRWKFEPATLNGQAVPAVVTITMNFRLH